ncbi:MAG: S1/P1 nuclease [Alistipes sp.]
MKKIYLLLLSALAFAPAANAWDGAIKTGIAAIADANLTPTAKKNIDAALGGHSIAYYAYWLDNVSGTEGYTQTKAWHHVAFTAKNKLIPAKKAEKSKNEIIQSAQAYEALVNAVGVLQNRGKATKEEIADNIRFVVCILADLHCPSHYVYADLLPQREWKYYYGGKAYNYMRFWENTAFTNAFSNWRANEFVHQLNRKSDDEIRLLTAGSLTEWIVKNAEKYRSIYTMITPDQKFDKKTIRLWYNQFYPLSTEYITEAGYRLARVLNGLFDDEVAPLKVK